MSLAEEARNTKRRHVWNADLKLRHTQVSFISAGASGNLTEQDERTEPAAVGGAATLDSANDEAACLNPERSMADMSLCSKRALTPSSLENMQPGFEDSHHDYDPDGVHPESLALNDRNDFFVIDSNRYDQAVQTGFSLPTVRQSSPSTSTSGEEVVVFRGRGRSRQPQPPVPLVPVPESGANVVMDASSCRNYASETRPQHQASQRPQVVQHEGNIFESSTATKRPRRRKNIFPSKGVDEGIIDYIANIREHGGVGQQFLADYRVTRDLGDEDADLWQDETGPSTKEENSPGLTGSALSEDNIPNLDELGTSSKVLGAVASILSKRERLSGPHYLVVWKGINVDDAKWIPHTSMDMEGASDLIAEFEAREALAQEYLTKGEDIDGDSELDEQAFRDVANDILEMEEEEAGLDIVKVRMTDEQIARRLAKQEELGLGSAEVILFDGDEMGNLSDGEGIRMLSEQAISYVKGTRSTKGKTKSPSISTGLFADVSPQDPYNGFKVMDHGRSGLRRRPKGRRGALPPELSDSELETSMQITWDNDRTKKKLQKQHREELRAQGLLGRKDMLQKKSMYSGGMSIIQVKNEIKDFLMSDRPSTSFQPMDKNDRKLVHEIANVFNLKSKSIGGGRSRYPVLFKTSRSIRFSEGRFEDVEALLNQRRFLPHMDKQRARAFVPKSVGRSRGGGASEAAVSYRDGEIVGAAAPELGTDNKGRAMLEKMGWSTGTALGALNNKGIMQPVMHIVKTTKAGLG
ncbi:hypothetical protein MMC13_005824 [Lambiella insularis]|nr:hypothetical protein [Lambiella insularis]